MGKKEWLFIIEALGKNKQLYNAIDQIYKFNKYKFYEAAKNHEFYNGLMITEGSIIQEEYLKKLLGIIVVAKEDEFVMKQIYELAKKAYNWTYLYVKNNRIIYFQHYHKALAKKMRKLDDSLNQMFWNMCIMLFLASKNGNKIIEDEISSEFAQFLLDRASFYMGYNRSFRSYAEERISLENQKINNLKKFIFEKYGKINNFSDMTKCKFEDKDMDECLLLSDFEGLASDSIFKDIDFTDKDIDLILFLYTKSPTRDLNDAKTATEYLITHMYFLYLLKAYKQVKKMYFENNKETMYVELEEVEKELKKTNNQLKIEKQAYNNLDEKYKILEKENERLKAELEQEKKNRQELNGLREFFFSLNNKEEYLSEDFNKDSLKEFKAVLIGGHEKWQHKMKEYLPNFTFIHLDNINFDKRILDGISHLFVFPNYLSHPIYYKATNAVAGKGAKVIYLENQNEDLVLRQIYTVYSNAC